MRLSRILALGAAVIGTTLVAPVVPPAYAEDPPIVPVVLTPTVVQAGNATEVAVACPSDSGEASLLDDKANALATTKLKQQPGGAVDTGMLTVPATTPAGSYSVWVQCGDKKSTQGTAPLSVTPRAATTPTAPPKTGDGSAFSGPNTGFIAMGGALILVAGAGGAVLLKRRRYANAS